MNPHRKWVQGNVAAIQLLQNRELTWLHAWTAVPVQWKCVCIESPMEICIKAIVPFIKCHFDTHNTGLDPANVSPFKSCCFQLVG